MGRDTVRKVEQINEKATAEVIAKVRAGELSINAAAKTVAPPKEAKPAKAPKPPPTGDLATPAPPMVNGEVAVTELVALQDKLTSPEQQYAEMREEYEDLKTDLAETIADNESMGRVFDADDHLKATMDEAVRQRAIADSAEHTLFAKMGEFAERILVQRQVQRAEHRVIAAGTGRADQTDQTTS